MFGSFGFERLHAWSPGRCGGVLGRAFLQTLSVFGSSLVRQNLCSRVFWLQSSAASSVFGSGGSRLGWAGSVLAG